MCMPVPCMGRRGNFVGSKFLPLYVRNFLPFWNLKARRQILTSRSSAMSNVDKQQIAHTPLGLTGVGRFKNCSTSKSLSLAQSLQAKVCCNQKNRWSYQWSLYKYSQKVGPVVVKSGTSKTPPTLKAHSFRTLSWNSASWPPLYLPSACSTTSSMHLTIWNFQCIALEPEIPWKRWFARAFRKFLFSRYATFISIWKYKTHDLTDHQLTVGSFLRKFFLQ